MNEEQQNQLVQDVAANEAAGMLLYQAIDKAVEGLENEKEARQFLAQRFVKRFNAKYD